MYTMGVQGASESVLPLQEKGEDLNLSPFLFSAVLTSGNLSV